MNNLPVEVVTEILKIDYPVLDLVDLRFHDEYFRGIVWNFHIHFMEYSQRRLVSSLWCHITSPFLFHDAVLDPWNHAGIANFFGTFGPYVRYLVIRGSRLKYNRDISAEAIGVGLQRCTNLQKLDCPVYHDAFLHPNWMSQYAPNLVKTLTTLRINASRGRLIQLFHSLVGLGGVLENLIIEDWDPSVNLFYFLVESRHVPEDLTIENWDSSKILSSSFHLPKRFPKLQHVAYNWLHDYPTTLQMDWAKELFHRVTADKASNPLQSLHLIFTGYFEDEQLSQLVPDILSILSINNLGLKLETLHLHLCWSQRFEMAETVLRLCPNLVNLSYLSSFPKAALELLSPSIEHLELPIGMEKFSIKAPDIVHFLQHKRCPALRNLNIYLYWLLSGEVQEIVDYCNEFNLAISRPMRDKKTSSYIRSIVFPPTLCFPPTL